MKFNYKETPTYVIVFIRVSKYYRLADADVTLLQFTASVRQHDTTLKDKHW
jgi:hypothetical protein